MEDRGLIGWLINTARSNYWRVASHYEIDDLVQDGYLHIARLRQRYPDATPREFMVLFKRTFTNHIHDLSKKRTKSLEQITTSLDSLLENLPQEQNTHYQQQHPRALTSSGDFELLHLIADAPPNLRKLLERIRDKPEAVFALYRFRPDGTRETVSDRMARLIGVPAGSEIFKDLKLYLSGVTRSAV